MFSVVFSWVVKWLRRKKIEYNKLGLFESAKFRHHEIQSWTACRIIKLVAYYEIPLVFAITTKERENIAYFRFLESARRHFTRTNKMNNKIVCKSNVMYTGYWIILLLFRTGILIFDERTTSFTSMSESYIFREKWCPSNCQSVKYISLSITPLITS